MKNLIILFIALVATGTLYSQDLVKIWEGEPGSKFSDFGLTVGLRSSSLSDFTGDGVSDIVLNRKGSNTLYIIDGKTKKPVDSLEIETTASLCNNEVIEDFHLSAIDIDPNNIESVILVSRPLNGTLRGTRSDGRIVMSGGSTMLTYPCDYQLKGFIDPEGDGYLIITMENLTDRKVEIWGVQ